MGHRVTDVFVVITVKISCQVYAIPLIRWYVLRGTRNLEIAMIFSHDHCFFTYSESLFSGVVK